MYRTHTCGELRKSDNGQSVTLAGWVDSYRDHGGGLFVDLRDRYGKTQLVFSSDSGAEIQQASRSLRNEDVIQVVGKVEARPDGTVNPKLITGEIEIKVEQLTVLNKCKTPPFFPSQMDLPGEDLRLKHR